MKVVFPYDGYEHLGIGYCAAAAIKARHQVSLHRVGIGDYITGYRRLTAKSILNESQRILAEKPDVVAFSLVSPTAGAMMDIAVALRKAGIRTIAGGAHAAAEPDLTVAGGAFDALVKGEADEVFAAALEWVSGCLQSPPGWLHTPRHAAVEDPPLPNVNLLPFPAKELFYAQSPFLSRDYLIMSSRSCPYSCIYCSRAGSRRRYAQRSPYSLLAELRWAKEHFAPQTVYFIDDLFGFDSGWMREFLPLYKKEICLPFHAITHPQHIDAEKAALLHECGCFALRIGVQTLTPRIRARLHRIETGEQVHAAIAAAKRAGIRVEVDHMVDLPGETIAEAREGARFYAAARPDAIKVYWLMPLPGSRWFAEAQAEGRLDAKLAGAMRQGKGFGKHSYLFRQHGYSNRTWFGIAALLVFLPFLPARLIRFLLAIKADRYFGVPSFVLTVGLSRLLLILRGWDRVGEGQLQRIRKRILPSLRSHKTKQ